MLSYFLQVPRFHKRLISLCVDTFLIVTSFWLSYWIRLDVETPINSSEHWLLLCLLIPVTLFSYVRLGLYRAVLRYVSFRVLLTVLSGVVISSFFLIASAFIFHIFLPRSTAILFFLVSFVLVGGSRLFVRMVIYGLPNLSTKVLIYGAGASGRQLQLALNQSPEYAPVVFIDDDKKYHDAVIQGLRVLPSARVADIVDRYKIVKILLALPSVSTTRRQEILQVLEPLPCEVLSVPRMIDLVSGKSKIDELKEVPIEDLLGRETIPPNQELMSKHLTAKSVLVTGAGGSIGSELCRQIVLQKPTRLVLLEHSEYSLYEIDKELRQIKIEQPEIEIIPVLGSVQNKSRIASVLKRYNIETVFHAAAYKHVPLVEYNIVEGIRNNIFGTINCATAAVEAGVNSFVLISTDKAVRPTNIMGASKRVAELVLQALSKEKGETTFSMVRFGNVLGSSGSVVPLFRKQIKDGGPVTVTHPKITRYFMTIPEASQLVIQAGAMGEGGDVFVLDMGEPIKIADLACKMIHLSGYSVKNLDTNDGDIAIEYYGLRPGEKLYEELLIGEGVKGTIHDRIMTAHEEMLPWEELLKIIADLDVACKKYDLNNVRDILINAPANFKPSDGICDLLWQEKESQSVDNIRSIK